MRDHADRYGWSRNTRNRTRVAVRVLAGRQATPGPFRASDVTALQDLDIPSPPVLAVLREAGLLHDDRVAAINDWFERQLTGLPPTMAEEMRVWFDVLHNGTTIPPRRRPRSPITIRTRVYWASPTLHAWAAAGHTSLREISRQDVISALPPSGNPRATTGTALRSIFTTLRQRKIIFTNPTVRIPIGTIERRQPLPADLATMRRLLNSDSPACATIAALIVFHGLRSSELRSLRLVDVHDGRLNLDRRSIVLATETRQRLTAWLDHRQGRWASTANPHLFIHHRNAGNLDPVGRLWLARTLGVAPSVLRTDRILDEAIATNGDVRRLCDLFAINVNTAERYARILDPHLT